MTRRGVERAGDPDDHVLDFLGTDNWSSRSLDRDQKNAGLESWYPRSKNPGREHPATSVSGFAIPGILPAESFSVFRCHVGLEVREPLEKLFTACRAEDFAAISLFNGHTFVIH